MREQRIEQQLCHAVHEQGGIAIKLASPSYAGLPDRMVLLPGGHQQMNARLFRQGQKAETVVILHIICRDTIDERILRVLSAKEKTQDALIEAVRAEIGKGRDAA